MHLWTQEKAFQKWALPLPVALSALFIRLKGLAMDAIGRLDMTRLGSTNGYDAMK
jgi:hypothetical protein